MLLFEIQIQTESSNPCYCLCICRFRIIAIYTIIFCFSGWIQIFQLYGHIIVIRFACIDYTHTEYIHDLYRLESGWCSTYDDTQEVNYANFNEFAPLFSRDTRMSIQSYLIHATPRSTVHSFDLQVPSEQRLCILFFSSSFRGKLNFHDYSTMRCFSIVSFVFIQVMSYEKNQFYCFHTQSRSGLVIGYVYSDEITEGTH